MEKLIRLLIRKAYFHYRDKYYSLIKKQPLFSSNEKLTKIFDSAIRDPLLFFGGFETSYDVYGSKITQEREVWEGFYLTEHYVYLNRHFLLNLLGYQNDNPLIRFFDFVKLIETIAHEVSHCLLRDLCHKEKEHGEKHKKIQKELEEYLWSLSLVKEWKTKMWAFTSTNLN